MKGTSILLQFTFDAIFCYFQGYEPTLLRTQVNLSPAIDSLIIKTEFQWSLPVNERRKSFSEFHEAKQVQRQQQKHG